MLETAITTRWSSLIVLFVWLCSAIYLGRNLNSRWVPADEGTLGQSAERVLHGEMPHRDFDDPYTGGLAYIDAFIFKLFGINLFWLRLFLFACFLIWVLALCALAREFLSPWPAAGATLIAVVWSVPNYTAAIPSWFNLFLATFGTLSLAKCIRKPSIYWLVLAGLCGGCSFLIKSVALYYVAGALLFFFYCEQSLSRIENAPPRRTPLYLAFLSLCLSVFVLSLIKLVFTVGEFSEYLHFVFPGVIIALLLVYRERTSPTVSDLSRFRALFRMAVPFLLAAVVPVALFCIFYWRHDALAALMNGLFVTPFRRLLTTRMAPNGLLFEYPAVLGALFIMETAKLRGRPRQVLSIFLALLVPIVLFYSRSNDLAFIIGISSALGAIPVLVLAALLVLSTEQSVHNSSLGADHLLALFLTMTVLFSLIQFPFASPGYFWYVSPLVVLLAAALLSRFSQPPRIVLYALVAFYVLFPVYVLHPQFMGGHRQPAPSNTPLSFPRAGGLRVMSRSVAEYEELIPFVKNLADGGSVLAGPDCPEVYFLAGIKNPTPILYDSLEDPRDYEKNMRSLFDRPNFLKAAVIHDIGIALPYQAELLRSLARSRFPNSRKIGSFTVYWR
jgi:Dolichyl-phosphate-mannose-protein mannosyltransferase